MIDLSKIPTTCGVYCFKNKINNKIYIGITNDYKNEGFSRF